MSITIYTIIDDDIVINETIQESEDTCTQSKMIDKNKNECSGNANATTIYDYLIKIVSTYSNYILDCMIIMSKDVLYSQVALHYFYLRFLLHC